MCWLTFYAFFLFFLVPFDEYKLHVPVETEAWPEGRAERISVNSFGIGGVNAHVSDKRKE